MTRTQHNIELAIVIFFMGIWLYAADPEAAKLVLALIAIAILIRGIIGFFS